VLKVRAAVSALLAAALAVTIAGCSFTNGNQILPRKYDPSDGVGANVGELDIRNALLVSEDGARGSLVVSVINTTQDTQPLKVQYASDAAASGGRNTVNLSVPAHSTVTYGYRDSEQLVLEGIDTTPGALFPVFFQSGSSEGIDLDVPVLDQKLAEYNDLTPSPTPTPRPTPTSAAVPTPSPTAVPIPAPTPTASTVG